MEFESGEHGHGLRALGLAALAGFDGERQVHIGANGYQLPAAECLLAVLGHLFFLLALEVVQVCVEALEVGVLTEQFFGGLLTDAAHPGHVV